MGPMHITDGLFIDRTATGNVRLYRANPPLDVTIADNHWASAVLSVTAFGERPNDWHKFMDHHHGRKDMLNSPYMGNKRNQVLAWTPAEHAIHKAVDVVEAMGADAMLTDAVILLSQARQAVAEYVLKSKGSGTP